MRVRDLRAEDARAYVARVAAEKAAAVAANEPGVVLAADTTVVAGRRIMERPRQARPDALFAANDLLALGLLQSLQSGGTLLVPAEMSLIGFDDISFAAAAAVPLSSVRQPSRMIGQTALRVLLEESEDATLIPRQTVFRPELVVRASTQP